MAPQLTYPLPGAPISDRFGWRTINGVSDFHTGVDFPSPAGTPIQACAAGVARNKQYDQSYGNMIDIDHGDGVVTRYAHMQAPSPLSNGSSVARGQTVGPVGSTGWSTGPHLHLEVILHGTRVDPLPHLNNTGEDMPTAQEIANAILDTKIQRRGGTQTGTTSLRAVLSYQDALFEGIAGSVLDAKIPRAGGTQVGNTTVRQVTAYTDALFEAVIDRLPDQSV